MGKGEQRLSINNLVPGERYAIQVRAIDNGQPSGWSQKYPLTTIDDTAGGTRTPNPPVLSTWQVNPTGHYVATWATDFTNTDGTMMVVKRYELELVAAEGTVIVTHYVGSGATQERSFTLNTLKATFGSSTVPLVIQARLRIINSADTVSAWSEPLTASLPVPNPPTNPSAESVIDAVKVKWEPPLDPIHLFGYRVYVSMTDPEFLPDVAGRSNLRYEGPMLEFPYTSLSYDLMHYFKIVSYSEAGMESTWVTAEGKPKSPYGPDLDAPLIPVLAVPTMDRTVLTAPKANLAWTIEEAHADNADITGFVIRYRITGEVHWRTAYFDKSARAGIIDLTRPFSNYEFQIAAYDFVANYSEYSASQSLIGASDPPPAVTGVDSIPRWDGLRIVWNESTESVKYGGRYEVQLKTTNSFPDNTPEYVTGNTFIDVTGLAALSTWNYRIRAIDSANQAGPWSVVDSATLPPFPVAAATDGVAPATAPQNIRATGGLNYVNVSWERVNNNDPVFYEVYMATTVGVTATPANFVGQSSGTSLMVATLPNGSPLIQEQNYYFKVRAVDADNPGPLSSEAISQLTQVLGTDLGINTGGENLYFNSSLDVDSDGNGTADYWVMYNNTPQTEPSTATLVTGRDGVGKAQRIEWTGLNTSTKGIYGGGNTILRPNTEYVLSFYARGNGGSGFSTANNAPFGPTSQTWLENDPVTTTYKRYIAKYTTPATVESNNLFITVVNHSVTGTAGTPAWIEIDDVQIEAGNIASAYKTGTVSIAKLATGRLQSADMIISTGGRIVSETYLANNATGFLITDNGITIKNGLIDAKTLAANTTITSNLYVGALLEMASGGLIRSANYNPGVAGYSLSSVGLDIRTGTVGAGTLVAGTISSPDIRLGAGGKLTIDANGSIVSNNYAFGTTGFKISNDGIEMWDANSKINVNALETGMLTSTYIRIGSGGYIGSATWDSGVGARWLLSENAFTMYNGTITGSTIITDQLYSAQSETAGGVTRRKFSINASGYAEFSGVYVYGNMIIGNSAAHIVQSGNYNGQNAGWRLQGDGVGHFFQLNTYSMNIYHQAVVGNWSEHYIKSASYDGANGWIIRGNGVAEFWGGLFTTGSYSGGQIRLTNWGSGESLIQFLVPGDWSRFAYLKASGQNFDIRGGWGGAIVFTADTTVRSSLHHAVDYDIWAGRNINAGNGIGAPTLSCSAFGGDPVFNWVGGSQFSQYALFGASGRLNRGANNSSREYKDDINPLVISVKSVLSLEPKSFFYKDEHKELGHGKQAGFIAEEAESLGLIPWVLYSEDTETGEQKATGFNYPMFSVAQQIVLREHQSEIEDLKSQVAELVKLVKSLS